MEVPFSIIIFIIIPVEKILILYNPWCLERDVKLEYKVLKEKIKEFNKKDAKFYGNMFAKLNKLQPFDANVRFLLSVMLFLIVFIFPFLFSGYWNLKLSSSKSLTLICLNVAEHGREGGC